MPDGQRAMRARRRRRRQHPSINARQPPPARARAQEVDTGERGAISIPVRRRAVGKERALAGWRAPGPSRVLAIPLFRLPSLLSRSQIRARSRPLTATTTPPLPHPSSFDSPHTSSPSFPIHRTSAPLLALPRPKAGWLCVFYHQCCVPRTWPLLLIPTPAPPQGPSIATIDPLIPQRRHLPAASATPHPGPRGG